MMCITGLYAPMGFRCSLIFVVCCFTSTKLGIKLLSEPPLPPHSISLTTLLTNRIIRLPPRPLHKHLRLSSLHPILLHASPIGIILILIVVLHLTPQIRIIIIVLLIVFIDKTTASPSPQSLLPDCFGWSSLFEILLVRFGHDLENRLLAHRLNVTAAEGTSAAEAEAGTGTCRPLPRNGTRFCVGTDGSFLFWVGGARGRGWGSCPRRGGSGADGAANALADTGGHRGDGASALLLDSACSDAGFSLQLSGGRLLAGTLDELIELVGKRSIARGLVLGYVGAVLVFDTKDEPKATTDDFSHGDKEGDNRAVLCVVGEDGVEDPTEAEKRVDNHDDIVDPFGLERGDVSKERVADVFLE
ncbi:hypothetical protein B0T13DRAFT_321538 [Neurospora crassa]|nr:hypothetical protein B0T13DRAFT_321538 [Neurospora crassa]